MKATLTFDTSDVDEHEELRRCMAATKLCSVLWEITNKHSYNYVGDEAARKIYNAMEDESVDLDDIYR